MRRRATFAAACALVLFSLLAGCSSNNQPYNDTPAIQNLFPSNATAGGPSFTLNISGTGFIATSTAYWNNVLLTTTFNTDTLQISASVPASDIATAGVAQVTVVSPAPGGGISNAVTFTINPPSNPTPTISSLNPSSTPLNVLPANNVLLVNGTNFLQSSVAAFSGVSRATTFVSATQLSVPVLAADVAANATISVTVSNPTPGGGVSNASSFVVGLGHNARLKSNAIVSGEQVAQVVSVGAAGGASNGRSAAPAISADGRFVAFYSAATNLVAQGPSGNIFARDTCSGATNCTPQTIAVDLAADGSAPSAAPDGAPNADVGTQVAISGDGRFVAFASSATNLLSAGPASDAAATQVYVRDLCLGASAPVGCAPSMQLASIDQYGSVAAQPSSAPSISADGRFVAFVSGGSVLVRDTCAGASATPCVPATYAASAATAASALPASGTYSSPAISATGRYLAFVAKDSASRTASQVLLADMCLGSDAPSSCRPSLARISLAADGSDLAGANQSPSISADGRFVAFASQDTDGAWQIFLRDTCLGGSSPATCAPSTVLLAENAAAPSISANGRYLSYTAIAAANSASTAASGSLAIYDTCYGAASGCVAGANAPPFTSDSSSPAPLNSDGSAIAFSAIVAVADAPLSGYGDVFLYAPAF